MIRIYKNRRGLLRELSQLSEFEIYSYYLGESVKLKKKYHSPFKTDSSPSLVFYTKNGKLLWNDFTQGGDVIRFVKLKENLDFWEAVEHIVNNVKITNTDVSISLKEQPRKPIEFRAIPFTKEGLKYWDKYKISKNNLLEHNIYQIDQIDWNKDLMIINTSLKDVIVTKNLIDCTSVATQAEGTLLRTEIIKRFKDKFKKVYILGDNDKSGRELASKASLIYDIPTVFLSSKDPSDSVKEKGEQKTKVEILNEIKRTEG